MSVDFLEASVLVSEVAALAVRAQFLSVELPAILRLILVVETSLGFGDPVDLGELVMAVGILALETVPAEANLGPVLAHLSLVFL